MEMCTTQILYQAIDQGITTTVTTVNSHGKFFEAKTPRIYSHWNPKIDAIKSRRDHCSSSHMINIRKT